jgi:hypothetical protein
MGGDLSNALAQGSKTASDYIADKLGVDKGPDPMRPIYATSGDIQQGVESLTGPLYEPQTTGGKFTGAALRQLGNPLTYTGEGALTTHVAAGTAAGLAGEAGGEIAGEPGRLLGSIAGGSLTGKLGNAAEYARTRTQPPSVQALFDQADQHYANLHGYGVELSPQIAKDTADNITTELNTVGYREIIAPKTYAIVDELRNAEGNSLPTTQIEAIRRALGKVGYDPHERDAARRAISGIDDMMDNLQPANVVTNPQFAGQVGAEARLARANYAGAKRAEAIDNASDMAELRAASTGSGANIDNATRQQFRSILASPRKSRGFAPDELRDMREIVNGTHWGDAMRYLGKAAPTGIVSAAGGYALGHALGIPTPVVAAIGAAAKTAGDMSTKFKAARLSEATRLRTPLAQQMGSTPLPPRASGAASLAPLAQFGIPAMQNPYANGAQ